MHPHLAGAACPPGREGRGVRWPGCPETGGSTPMPTGKRGHAGWTRPGLVPLSHVTMSPAAGARPQRRGRGADLGTGAAGHSR